jgi:hypothetical protein
MKSSNGTLGDCDFYSGHVAVIKRSSFVNSRDKRSDSSQRFFIEIRQTDVVQMEFNK